MKKRFSDEQIISILREAEAGVPARELCRKHAISDATFRQFLTQPDIARDFMKLHLPAVTCSPLISTPRC